MITKARAGRMCAKVRAVCDANTLSSAAICGGAERGGSASAITRRNTTAIAITIQIQNPVRSQSGEECLVGSVPTSRLEFTNLSSLNEMLRLNSTLHRIPFTM